MLLSYKGFSYKGDGGVGYQKSYVFFLYFLKTFRSFRSFGKFSRNRLRRDDSFGPKIVEFRAILAIFRPFEDGNQSA